MKTAGYDIAVLINERFLNELAGALFYSGFLTVNGWVDFYNGKMMLEHQVMDYRLDLAQGLQGKVSQELQQFTKMDFCFKLTQTPIIDFVEDGSGQQIRFFMGMRIYLWLWNGLEIKFDSEVLIGAPILIEPNLNLKADLEHAEVKEFTLKYGNQIERQMTLDLDKVITDALKMYFADHTIEKRISIPSISNIIKDVNKYISADKDAQGNDLGIIPISVDAIRVVSPTVLAVGINLMDYHGGNPDELSDFALNCSVAVGVSEQAMHKVFSYVWSHGHYAKHFGNQGGMYIIKDENSLTAAKTGTFTVKKLNEIGGDISAVCTTLETWASKVATGGFVEASAAFQGMTFDYDLVVTLKKEPQFDLQGDNRVVLYNMAFDVYLRLACKMTVTVDIKLDTSGFIPDDWTPWDDDIVLYTETKHVTLFDQAIHLNNLELRYGKGHLEWDEPTQTLNLQVEKINLYWNFDDPNSLLHGLPSEIINWVTDQFEGKIVEGIPKIAVTPKLSFELPLIPWELKMTGRRLEINDSEAIVAADFEYEELVKGAYPVAKYIVNINNGEIHKIGCDSITDTYEVHQRAYHLLSEALDHGYDGCHNCLPAFHTH